MSNSFFPKYFIINFLLNSMYIMFNEDPSMKNFSLQEIYNNTKTEVKI